jgi:hypothetical protein
MNFRLFQASELLSAVLPAANECFVSLFSMYSFMLAETSCSLKAPLTNFTFIKLFPVSPDMLFQPTHALELFHTFLPCANKYFATFVTLIVFSCGWSGDTVG